MKTLKIRMTDDERRRLGIAAKAEDRSLNSFVMNIVRQNLEYFEMIAKRDENL